MCAFVYCDPLNHRKRLDSAGHHSPHSSNNPLQGINSSTGTPSREHVFQTQMDVLNALVGLASQPRVAPHAQGALLVALNMCDRRIDRFIALHTDFLRQLVLELCRRFQAVADAACSSLAQSVTKYTGTLGTANNGFVITTSSSSSSSATGGSSSSSKGLPSSASKRAGSGTSSTPNIKSPSGGSSSRSSNSSRDVLQSNQASTPSSSSWSSFAKSAFSFAGGSDSASKGPALHSPAPTAMAVTRDGGSSAGQTPRQQQQQQQTYSYATSQQLHVPLVEVTRIMSPLQVCLQSRTSEQHNSLFYCYCGISNF
jgi:hypothetical protein